jgi:tetratricopeptide (TPR) repeat protein
MDRSESLRHLEREKALLRYYAALEGGDFAVVASVLREAREDAELERMIMEFNAALAAAISSGPSHAPISPEALLARAFRADSAPAAPRISARAAPDSRALPDSSLHVADAPAWRLAPGYSPIVANALVTAYRVLSRSRDAKRYDRAYTTVVRLVDTPMAVRQRVHVLYVCGMAQVAVGEYASALRWLDKALDLASSLGATGDIAELLFLRGAVLRALLRLKDAAADYAACLALLREESAGSGPSDAPFELAVLSQLAGFTYYLGQIDRSEQLLRDARKLAPLAPGHLVDAATTEWIQAHIFRARSQPELALRPALAAADIYLDAGQPTSAARIQILVAEIALDLADHFTIGSARSAFAKLGHAHTQVAKGLAKEAGDAIGEALAALASARYSRLCGRNENRIARLERVAHTAQQLDDSALLAQAVTALGDELASLGEKEQALNRYRDVISVLDRSDMPTLSLPARRALLLSQEM